VVDFTPRVSTRALSVVIGMVDITAEFFLKITDGLILFSIFGLAEFTRTTEYSAKLWLTAQNLQLTYG